MNHYLSSKVKVRGSEVALKSSSSSAGFSLVEVLISILMIAGFLATAMQALISATAIKVRSEEISEATTWMQEDLEAIKFEANQLGFDKDTNTYDPDINGDGNLNECDAGFADLLKTDLEDRSDTPPPPPYHYPSDQGQRKESSIGQRPYILIRNLTVTLPPDSNPDPNLLKVKYEVFSDRDGDLSKAGEGAPIGELYSEVIPDVAFACPLG